MKTLPKSYQVFLLVDVCLQKRLATAQLITKALQVCMIHAIYQTNLAYLQVGLHGIWCRLSASYSVCWKDRYKTGKSNTVSKAFSRRKGSNSMRGLFSTNKNTLSNKTTIQSRPCKRSLAMPSREVEEAPRILTALHIRAVP